MNLSKPPRAVSRFLHLLFLQCRTHLPRQQCLSFVPPSDAQQSGIGPIFVINLDRQPDRCTDVLRELACILDAAGKPLSERVVRYSACDAQTDARELLDGGDVEPFYTLGDQLFVEPQPNALPDAFDLTRPIRMSPAEVAVCALAHRRFGEPSHSRLPPMLLYLRTTSGSSVALGEPWTRLGARWKTLIEPVLPSIFSTCLIRKRATVLQRNWFRGTCFVQNAGFGICLGMCCRGKGLKRYSDFFRAAAPSISGSITSSEKWTCGLFGVQ